jgi:endonuclease/exonuclease/phosphatase family metal-dependent hydrolase
MASPSISVGVMSFNICLGGEAIDIAQVAAAIVASGADVVGLQEAGANTPTIAQLVGFAHVDERHQVISRWPLAAPSRADRGYVYVHPSPTTVFAIANVHLPSDPYGPYLLRDGHAVEEVLDVERETRLDALRRRISGCEPLLAAGVPVVVTGDFNVPAHTDWGTGWTEHRITPVPWPVSGAMTALGFTDTYRAANPGRAGLTWTYGYPYPLGAGDEPLDRIDFVWAAGHDDVVHSTVVGPAGAPDVGVPVDPWPSDHLAVSTTLTLTSVEPPPYVAPFVTRLEVGDLLRVRFATSSGGLARICVAGAGDGFEAALMWVAPMEVERFGTVTFGTAHLPPGEYDVVLVTDGVEVDRGRIWVVGRGDLPTLLTHFDRDALVVSWSSAYGRRFDRIAVYPAGEADLEHGAVAVAETEATISGSHTFENVGGGPFTVRLLADSSIAILAQTEATRPA